MTFHLFRHHCSKVLALVTVLGSADSLITLGASAVTFGCENEGAKACTTSICLFGVKFHIATASEFPMGETLTATLCRGNACVSGPFILGGADAAVPGITGFTIPANPAQSNSPRASIRIERFWGIDIEYSPSSPDDLADGDHYTFTIENAAGEELLTKETTVTYKTSYDPECDPYVCRQADVTL